MINIEKLYNEFKSILGEENIKKNEPMKNHTAFKLGGPADILIMPTSIDLLINTIDICKKNDINFYILGNGSNLIVRDKGIRGVVIKSMNNLRGYKVEDEMIEAEAGILLSTLANIALKNQLEGLEFASGIPGTLGGGVVMNAGAYGGEMKDVVYQTEYLDNNLNRIILDNEMHEFGYRTSLIQKNNGIVLKCKIKLKHGDPLKIKNLMDDLSGRRKEKQPIELPSAGSVFKRPEGFFVGKLVEDCGLKGYSIGKAQVSTKHCGFIVNKGDATSKDVIKLIEHVKETISREKGIKLQTEVKIVGEEY